MNKIKFIPFILILLICTSSAQAQSQNKLDASRSKIEFVSVKDQGVNVPGTFNTMEGIFSFGKKDSLSGEVTVDIDSLSTGNPARDQNLKELFFETGKKPGYKTARFLLKGRTPKEDIPIDGQTKVLKGTLEMHGKKVSLDIPLSVTERPDSIQVKTASPIVLDFSKWNLMVNVPTLMKACGHKNLEPKASLNLDLVFAKGS